MNQSLRYQFIALYEMPLLDQLRDMFVLRFPKACGLLFWVVAACVSKTSRCVFVWFQLDFPPIPPRGSLDLELVKQSPYFFN
jgi:DNA-directed RNA polymerase